MNETWLRRVHPRSAAREHFYSAIGTLGVLTSTEQQQPFRCSVGVPPKGTKLTLNDGAVAGRQVSVAARVCSVLHRHLPVWLHTFVSEELECVRHCPPSAGV